MKVSKIALLGAFHQVIQFNSLPHHHRLLLVQQNLLLDNFIFLLLSKTTATFILIIYNCTYKYRSIIKTNSNVQLKGNHG